MSKMPYVIQQDSPNLVIVPTETCYEPSPKKTKLENASSTTKVQQIVQASEKSALVNNAGEKVKPRVSSVNTNVLIDVSKVKRQPNSWATNFLQSIGGSASKPPRVYNWHSSASTLGFLRNENIQPINYLPAALSEINTKTTDSNANKESTQLKSKKECTPTKTNTSGTQSKLDFSLSNGTNVTTKTQCSQPKLNKEADQSSDNIAYSLPTVNKDSSHLKANKEATLKTKKEASQPKPTKEVIHLKPNNSPNTKKYTQTKAINKKKCRKEATKLRDKLETCRTKLPDKASDKNVHKEKFKSKILKEITENKPSKTQRSLVNRESISFKKIKVYGTKSRVSGGDKNKKSEVSSKKIKRESSKSSKSTSPIRSVVKKIQNHTSGDTKYNDKYELNHNLLNLEKMSKDSDADLRAKLKRRVSRNDDCMKEYESREKRKCNKLFPTMPNEKRFVPDENLIISFDTENDKEVVGEKMEQVKTKTRKHQSGGKKCKKIKLEINIVFEKDDTSDDESAKSGIKEDYENNNDLSFLDDFNVDEIAESLNDCHSNLVKIDNLTNFNEHTQTSKIGDLPITNDDDNPGINNNESISKCELLIENNITRVSSLTHCNEKSTIINTENKAIETNVIGVKTEFVANDAVFKENIICAECSKDLSAKNYMEKLSESVTLPGEQKLKNVNILTCAEIKSEEAHNPTPSMQLDTKNTNKLQKVNTGSDKTTNIDSDKNVAKLAPGQNRTLPSDATNKHKTMRDNNPATAVQSIKVETVEASIFVDKIEHEDEVILVEDSDNDCYNNMTKVQGLVEHNIIDLTCQKDCSLDTKCKEVSTVDAVKPKTTETDSEPILILDTDYDELKVKYDLKNKKGITETEKKSEPIDIIKKHLFCSDKILEKPDTVFNHNINRNTKKSNFKSNETVTHLTNSRQNKSDVKIKNATAKNVTPSVENEKDTATNKGSDTTPVDIKDYTKAGQDQAQTKTQSQKTLNGDKKSTIAGEHMLFVKENHDKNIKMREVNKDNATAHNTVTPNQANTNAQDYKDAELNVEVKSAIAEKLLSHTKENDDIDITMWVENKISQAMKAEVRTKTKGKKKKGGKVKNDASKKNLTLTAKENYDGIRMWVVNKGDTRTHAVVQKQPKPNPEDTIGGKPKIMDNMNTQTQSVNATCQPNERNMPSTQVASVGNKNAPAKQKQDIKTNMMVKGDPRIKQNRPKTNLQNAKDRKSHTVNSINPQNVNTQTLSVNAKYQPNEPNMSSTQVASVGNKNAPAKEKQDNKTNMMVKGDPRIKQNQPKTNLQNAKDRNSHTVNSINSQNVNTQTLTVNAKCQPNEPNMPPTQVASVGNKNVPAKEKQDNKKNMMVKGDPRIKQNQPITNLQNAKDRKSNTVNNINSQNVNTQTQSVNATCQPKEPNMPSTQVASVGNKNEPAKERQDNKKNMMVKGDPRIKQNQPKTNLQNAKDGKSNTVNNINSQNVNTQTLSVNAKYQPNEPNMSSTQVASVGNKNAPAKEKQDNKTNMMVKGDPRIKQNQPKANLQNAKDGKSNTANNINSPNVNTQTQSVNATCQPKEPNMPSTQVASVGNKNEPAKEKQDNKTDMMVKGDPRIKQNQPKANLQNANATCQPNEPNMPSTQVSSVGNKNAPAKEIQDNKTNMMVKGDPRIKQNQPKTNLQNAKDGKSNTVNNINSQNVNTQTQSVNATCQPNEPLKQNQPKTNLQNAKDGKSNTANNINSQNVNARCQPEPNKCNPQAKCKNSASGLAHQNLVDVDSFARRLEFRMREYFGARYWITDLIHSGEFSKIYRCKDGAGVSKTVKQIKDVWQVGANKEAMMMKLQKGVPENNYNCVRHGNGFTVAGHWCYVMEFYPKNLKEAMIMNNKSFHIDKVQDFSRQLVAAVTILRNNNVIHSDINPTHILINESETRIKLCGFDQAFYYNGGDMLPNVGTVNYRAPELILGFHADYSIDVWATALIMYEMATNRQLFPGHYNNDILYKQFCTLANFPYEMLQRCYYRDQHFMGDSFVRIVGSRGEGKVLVRDFFKKERIYSVLFQVYNLDEWKKLGANRVQDKAKLNALGKLLSQMLVMDPRNRIAIEFVFADPFIFERF